MDEKINNLAKQYAQYHVKQKKQYEEQESVNMKAAKQLSFLVNNMQCFLKYATPNASSANLSPHNDGLL